MVTYGTEAHSADTYDCRLTEYMLSEQRKAVKAAHGLWAFRAYKEWAFIGVTPQMLGFQSTNAMNIRAVSGASTWHMMYGIYMMYGL